MSFKTPNKPLSVLYVQCELPEPELKKRAKLMVGSVPQAANHTGKLWLWTEHYLKLDTNAGYGLLDKHVEALKPDLVIIDPIYKVLSGSMLEYGDVLPFLDRMDSLLSRRGVAVMLISHPRKGGPDESGADDMLGSSLFPDWADTTIRVSRVGGTQYHETLKLEFPKVRYAEELMDDLTVTIDRRTLAMSASAISITEERKET